MEDFSCLLFHTLDCIGYSSDIIKTRRYFWQEHAKVCNAVAHVGGLHLIIAGSKGEGITTCFQSDLDEMLLLNDIICTSDIAAVSHIPGMTVIHADTRDAPPGYTRLKLIRRCNGAPSSVFLRECRFESESRDIYLSSSLLACWYMRALQRLDVRLYQVGDLSGPAVQAFHEVIPHDIVLAFNCYYPELLHSWASRPRYHNWPPADVIQDASSMLAQVVPVGSKGSCDQWREWRFCFIESELKLTCSLNETQLKLYILLKMVAKEILRQVSGEISSYIMKNVTYWLSELLPGAVFRKDNLFTLLVLSLRFLKSSIRGNWFPYYMIPGRNLLAERLTPDSRRRISVLIEELIQEGPQLLLRCSKLRAAFTIMNTEPSVVIKYAETRDLIEVLFYRLNLLKWNQADFSDVGVAMLRLINFVLPEWRMIVSRGIPLNIVCGVLLERIKAMLS